MRRLIVIALAAALLVACGAQEDGPLVDPDPDGDVGEDAVDDPDDDIGNGPDDEDATEPDPIENGDDADDGGASGSDAVLGAETQLVLDDVEAEFGVARDDIQVLVAEWVTFSDGSLGCPRPGEMYTQALVEGYRIVVEVDGRELTYHGAEGDDPFRCDDPQDPIDTAS